MTRKISHSVCVKSWWWYYRVEIKVHFIFLGQKYVSNAMAIGLVLFNMEMHLCAFIKTWELSLENAKKINFCINFPAHKVLFKKILKTPTAKPDNNTIAPHWRDYRWKIADVLTLSIVVYIFLLFSPSFPVYLTQTM